MIKDDIKFWRNSVEYWLNKAQAYLIWKLDEDYTRCLNRAQTCELYLQEAEGLISVVSGRKGFGL